MSGCLPITVTARDAGEAGDAALRDASENSLPDAASGDAEPAGDAGAIDGSEDGGSTNGLALSGTWALEVVGSDIVESNAVNEPVTMVTTSLARVEITQAALSLLTKTEICAVSSTPLGEFTTTHPAAAAAAYVVTESAATISADTIGATFTAAERAQLLGWEALIDVRNEALPQTEDDPRVRDADNDRNPGVSLLVQGPIEGELYVVARSVVTLNGRIESETAINGLSSAVRQQNTVGASTDLLAESQIEISPDPNVQASTFRLRRVPEGIQPACAEIIANRERIFR